MLIPKKRFFLNQIVNRNRYQVFNWSKDEIEDVLGKYEFSNYQICKVLKGGNSDNILLKTSKGMKVLKKYFWSLPSILFEHSIIQKLSEKRFPTPQLVLNQNGLSWTQLGDNHYAIYEYMKGFCPLDFYIPFKAKIRYANHAGALLAHLHEILEGFVPKGRKMIGYKEDGSKLRQDLSWHLKLIDQYSMTLPMKMGFDKEYRFFLDIKDQIKKGLIEALRHFEKNSDQLPKIVIHGDYSPKNMLIDLQGITSVLDFGDANLNLKVSDIARGVSTFAREGKHGINEKLSSTFFKAYQIKGTLSVKELSIIPDLIQGRYLNSIFWKIRKLEKVLKSREKSDRHLEVMINKWKRALWISNNKDKMLTHFLSMKKK